MVICVPLARYCSLPTTLPVRLLVGARHAIALCMIRQARLQNVYFIAPTGGSKKNPVRLVKSVYKGGRNKMASDIAAVDYGHYCGLVSVPAKNSSRKQRRARKNKPTLSGAGVGAGGEDDSVDLISKWCAMAKEGGLPGAILPSIAGMFSLRSEQVRLPSSFAIGRVGVKCKRL